MGGFPYQGPRIHATVFPAQGGFQQLGLPGIPHGRTAARRGFTHIRGMRDITVTASLSNSAPYVRLDLTLKRIEVSSPTHTQTTPVSKLTPETGADQVHYRSTVMHQLHTVVRACCMSGHPSCKNSPRAENTVTLGLGSCYRKHLLNDINNLFFSKSNIFNYCQGN